MISQRPRRNMMRANSQKKHLAKPQRPKLQMFLKRRHQSKMAGLLWVFPVPPLNRYPQKTRPTEMLGFGNDLQSHRVPEPACDCCFANASKATCCDCSARCSFRALREEEPGSHELWLALFEGTPFSVVFKGNQQEKNKFWWAP